MSKQVILSLGAGSLQQGFSKVTAQLRETPTAAVRQFEGSLPPAAELQGVYRRWWLLYELLLRLRFPTGRRIQLSTDEDVSHFSQPEFEDLSDRLVELLNEWLAAPGFTSLYTQLIPWLSVGDEIEIILDVNDAEQQLARLPWQEWNLFDTYPQASLSFSLTQFGPIEQQQRKTGGKVRILAVLGDSENIDVEVDRRQLDEIMDSEVTFLEQPTHEEFFAALASSAGWDILFFAGHSCTDKGEGYLQLSPTQKITLKKLKFGLKQSMKHGLHLAIFNSCDGLGLAQALAELEMPNIIVMRDTVPDLIAQTFLRHFLAQFSQESSIGLSVREAQGWLQGMADYLPRAGWLPVLYRNPAVSTLSWQELQSARGNETAPKHASNQPTTHWLIVLLSSLMTLGLILAIRSLGGLQWLELKAFDQLMQLRPAEAVDERFLIITIDEADIQAQEKIVQDRKFQGSLSNEVLKQVLDIITPYQPSVIGLDIYRDNSFLSFIEPYLKDNNLTFVASCRIDGEASVEKPSQTVPAPTNFPIQNLGFTDWPRDPDTRIRRQFLGMSSIEGCETSQSLSLRITLAYLEKIHGLKVEKMDNGDRQIGSTLLKKLAYNSGGYQLSTDDAKGYQIPINYREISPKQVALRNILNGSKDGELAQLITGRIILIGRGGAEDTVDRHFTPYSRSLLEDQAGVVIHAQMSSQIVSAVLDGRTLIWWWPQWLENLWIGIWSIGGAFILTHCSPSWKISSLMAGCSGLSILCFLFFLGGGWIPLVPSFLVFLLSGSSVLLYESVTVHRIKLITK